MDFSAEIKNNGVLLVIVPKEDYHNKLNELVGAIGNEHNKTCYVCVNQPYNFVKENIVAKNSSPDKFYFIDTLTKSVQEPKAAEDCIFVSAPNALTEISVALSKSLTEVKCDGILFDTISALLVYENPHSIIQFIHNVLTKIRIANAKAVFVALKEDVNNDLVKDLYMFVDKVLE